MTGFSRDTEFQGEDPAGKARRQWDEAAERWDHFVETGLDHYRTEFHGPALLEALGDVSGRFVLEMGCGQGWFCRQMARAGARVTGIDWSEGLLELARRHEGEKRFPIEYLHLDAAAAGDRFAPQSFEIVTGCMSLMDMPDPAAALRSARRLVVPDGRIVFSVVHPLTDTPHRQWRRDDDGRQVALEIDRYFQSGVVTTRWNMKRLPEPFETTGWRWTIEEWCDLVNASGLRIRRLGEPRATEEQVARVPGLDDARRLPYVLILDLVPEERR